MRGVLGEGEVVGMELWWMKERSTKGPSVHDGTHANFDAKFKISHV